MVALHRYKKYTLKLAREHEALEKMTKVEGYQMPAPIINEHDQKFDRQAFEAVLKKVGGGNRRGCFGL